MIKKLKTPALILFFMLFLSFGTDRASAGPLINDHLPKWMELDIQLRHRFEYRSNFDFNDALDDEDGFNLWRSRLGLTLKPMDDLKLFYLHQRTKLTHIYYF